MGKGEDEDDPSNLPPDPEASGDNAGTGCSRCRRIGRLVRPRCVAAVLFGLTVMLSAAFWLPPFIRHGAGGRGRHRSSFDGADIVGSFILQRPVSLLSANIVQLRYDIFGEIGIPNSSVAIVSLEPSAGLNSTNVVFSVWPYPKNSAISSTGLSLLRASFVSLVLQQSTLHLTTSLFGDSSSFEVLKFPGGITISPPQSAFLLQKWGMLFNFTLNFPIDEVQDKLNELKEQMKLGLLLNPYENLYVKLTNIDGSTISSPTIVQTAVVLAVGNHQPSAPRLKQLAQTITSSSQGNLGLNHTLFGRVKQIQLSSYLQHSLNGDGSSPTSFPPSPAPQPHLEHRHHHHHHPHQQQHHHHHHSHHRHHHHHHHSHHSNTYVATAPSPRRSHQAAAPSGCRPGISGKPKDVVQGVTPATSPQHSSKPRQNEDPPAPSPHLLSASPLPTVILSHAQPPSESATYSKPLEGKTSISPSPLSSSTAGHNSLSWILVLFMYLLMHL